jgi:monoamine oxidase
VPIAIAKQGKTQQRSAMAGSDNEVVVVGGGAAGIAAARRLTDAGVPCILVEARDRLGGRAFTHRLAGHALDLGCGWLHSADHNAWTKIAKAQGRIIDETPPPWMRVCEQSDFPLEEQEAFRAAQNAFFERIDNTDNPDAPSSDFFEPGGRWNPMIAAVTTYIAGAEPDCVAAGDFSRYEDSSVNWRIVEGYGTAIAAHAQGVRTVLACPVTRIDRSGKTLRVETARGTLNAAQVIVTLPTSLLDDAEDLFSPALPEKTDAARGVPLGLADKLFIALDKPEEFEADSRIYGSHDTAATATYHMRPFGRPMIEAYFGDGNADALEKEGERGFFDFSADQLAAVLGNDFRKRLKPIGMHLWRADPLARGSYSYALPGHVSDRARLAAVVEDRIFFAGEACSPGCFTTAHGAYDTGVTAAEAVLAARRARA